jgi:CHAT domain-containing protein
MDGELEAARANAEELASNSWFQESALMWNKVEEGAEKAYGESDPRAAAARSRMLREIFERGIAGGNAAPASAEAALSLAASLGPDAPEALFAAETAARLLAASDLKASLAALAELAGRSAAALGPGHPQTLSCLRGLASEKFASGDLPGAAAALETASEACSASFGRGCREVAEAVGNLGDALLGAGDAAGGLETLSRALALLSAGPGPESREALAAAARLGLARREAGDPGGAKEILAPALEACERVLGPADPQTLEAAAWLAAAQYDLGEFRDAKALLARVREADARQLGPGHPSTLAATAKLAAASQALGELAEARRLLEGACEASDRTLGAEDPDSLACANLLASVLFDSGELNAARETLERTLAGRERVLGPERRETLETMSNLALTLGELGEFAAAKSLQERALPSFLRSLGPDHPATLTAAANLAWTHSRLGDHAGARDAYRALAGARARVLGPHHPDTLSTLNDLATAMTALGDHSGANAVLAGTLAGLESALGPGHPYALAVKNNLAVSAFKLGDHETAGRLHSEVLDARKASLGEAHPNTLLSVLNVSSSRFGAGDYRAAAEGYASVLEAATRLFGRDHPMASEAADGLGWSLAKAGGFPSGIFFLKISVDSAQRVRATLASMDRQTRRGYLATVELRYRRLFDLLMREGRTDEALAVLGLLKEEELSVLDPSFRQAWAGETVEAAADSRETGTGTPWARTAETGAAEAGESEEQPEAAEALPVELGAAEAGESEEQPEAAGARPVELGAAEADESEARQAVPEERQNGGGAAEPPGAKAETRGAARPEARSGPRPSDNPGAGGGNPAAARASDPEPGADLFGGTRDEGAWLAYRAASELSSGLEAERAALEAEGANGALPEGKSRRLAELPGAVSAAKASFGALCDGIPGLLGPPGGGAAPGSWTAGRVAGRQAALRAMGPGAALLHAVPAEGSLWLIAVTPSAVASMSSETGRAEISRLSSELRALVASPARDPRPAAGRLYDAVIRPAESFLAEAGTATLMLSLDGELRYAPLAALWDGERWLAEKYPLALFTESTALRLRDAPRPGDASVRAMGVTAAWPGFPALPGVASELAAVVRTDASPDGALAGEALLDGDFTRDALASALASDAPVVHVASHFRLDPASLENTVLLLGDGARLNLREIWSGGNLDFRGLDLLTLSACDTASGASGGEGREVESLGEVVQRAGASAVLATLMPVADLSAPELMREFYRLRYLEKRDKAEALRGAQLKVMRGGPAGGGPGGRPAEGGQRGTALSAAGEAALGSALREAPRWEGGGFSHPFYWAPFVVMGSWR